MVLYHPVFRAGESHGLSILLCEVHSAHLYAHDALLDVGKSFYNHARTFAACVGPTYLTCMPEQLYFAYLGPSCYNLHCRAW